MAGTVESSIKDLRNSSFNREGLVIHSSAIILDLWRSILCVSWNQVSVVIIVTMTRTERSEVQIVAGTRVFFSSPKCPCWLCDPTNLLFTVQSVPGLIPICTVAEARS